jgi:hypothetical protein
MAIMMIPNLTILTPFILIQNNFTPTLTPSKDTFGLSLPIIKVVNADYTRFAVMFAFACIAKSTCHPACFAGCLAF